jgi:hypothetical protein
VARHLEAVKRDFLCAELIHRNTLDKTNPAISDSLIAAYYRAHGHALVRDKDVIKFQDIVVEDENTASLVRNIITRQTFNDVGQRYSKEPLVDSLHAPYIPLDKISGCLGPVISGIRIDGISAPIFCDKRYHIVHVLDKQSKGTPASLEECRPLLVEVLAGQSQKRAQEALIRDVRSGMNVALFLEQIPQTPAAVQPDSSAVRPCETTHGETK